MTKTTRIPVCMLAIKIGLFVITSLVFYLVSSPYPTCWGSDKAPIVDRNDFLTKNLLIKSNEGLCVKVTLFENFMCAGDPWKNPWWSVNLENPVKFCIARTSTYMAIFTQLALIFVIQLLHLFFLTKRSFTNYDPLDMIPAFFTISALSSVMFIQLMLSSNWEDLWVYNRLNVPSSPLPHSALTYVIFAGILLAAADWIIYHLTYNAEQDQIEEIAKSSTVGNLSPDNSNKQHGD